MFTYLLIFYLKFGSCSLAFYLASLCGILSDIASGILSDTYSDMFAAMLRREPDDRWKERGQALVNVI